MAQPDLQNRENGKSLNFINLVCFSGTIELADKVARYEAQKDERDALLREINDKKGQVERLDADILAKQKKIAELADPKPSSAASQPDKLAFFEGEVRKLESQLTQ